MKIQQFLICENGYMWKLEFIYIYLGVVNRKTREVKKLHVVYKLWKKITQGTRDFWEMEISVEKETKQMYSNNKVNSNISCQSHLPDNPWWW